MSRDGGGRGFVPPVTPPGGDLPGGAGGGGRADETASAGSGGGGIPPEQEGATGGSNLTGTGTPLNSTPKQLIQQTLPFQRLPIVTDCDNNSENEESMV